MFKNFVVKPTERLIVLLDGSLHHWGRLKPIRRHTARTTGKACGPADAKAGTIPAHGKTV